MGCQPINLDKKNLLFDVYIQFHKKSRKTAHLTGIFLFSLCKYWRHRKNILKCHTFVQDQASTSQVPYILFVLQAEEFCDLVSGGTLLDHVQKVRRQYPEFTICYVTNKLMSFIKRRLVPGSMDYLIFTVLLV